MSTGNRDEPKSPEHGARHDVERQIRDDEDVGTGRGSSVRESIWTISKSWQSVYFAFFSLQMVLGVSLIFWYHVFEHVEDGIVETFIGIVRDLASVSVGSAGTSYTLAEGARLLMILANNLEQWINKKWDERDARNRAEGIAIGVEEGEKKGRAIGVEEGEKKGRAVGIEEGEKKGRAVGLEEGRAEALAEFRAWNDRRISAESRGEFFDEPMPGSDNGSVHAEED